MRTFQELNRYFDAQGAGHLIFILYADADERLPFDVFNHLQYMTMFTIDGRVDLSKYQFHVTVGYRTFVIVDVETAKELTIKDYYHL